MTSLRTRALASVGVFMAFSAAGCSSDPEGLAVPNGEGGAGGFSTKGPGSSGGEAAQGGKSGSTVASSVSPGEIPKGPFNQDWFAEQTLSQRGSLVVPSAATTLKAAPLAAQLELYDPGSMIRCAMTDDPAYAEAVETIGGVTWGYSVSVLPDQSKPLFLAGFPRLLRKTATAVDAAAPPATPVEIVEADIVGLSESKALYLSSEHGLILVDLGAQTPTFNCATKLPGQVSKFYFYDGHLVVMTESQRSQAKSHSYLLYFKLADGQLRFSKSVDLGEGRIKDSRRFNDKLVVYKEFLITEGGDSTATSTSVPSGVNPSPSSAKAGLTQEHRMLRVFKFDEELSEEMSQTLLDTSPPTEMLTAGSIPESTAPGTLVSESSRFGGSMWASDHYFVVTEALNKTYLKSFVTQTYNYCTQSHTVEVPYQHCDTKWETRPNPNYTPPDNSGGDRSCVGITLAECLRGVARVANPTIQVAVGTTCETRTFSRFVCDAWGSGSYTYPEFESKNSTRLFIYEYTDKGFVRLSDKVSEIVTPGLETKSTTDVIPTLTTSTTTYDLALPGDLQTIQFQNGFLYAISGGQLQIYAIGDGSLVRTASLQVTKNTLQTSLFANNRLYLSDFSYTHRTDSSVLRIVDLKNPGFPTQLSTDRSLPGGHSNILPASQGLLTIGTVQNFENHLGPFLKLGLFTDPFAEEQAYLVLGTDLEHVALGGDKAFYFDTTAERLFLPYQGIDPSSKKSIYRVGVSHLEPGTVVTEGALDLPEPPLRVRARPGYNNELISFASNSLEWLRPEGTKWKSDALLEYWKPIALYRTSNQDDYIEVLKLGERCKLHFSEASHINEHSASNSSPFDCVGSSPWAYGNNLVFSSNTGVRFDKNGAVTTLSSDEILALQEQLRQRPYCVISQNRVDNQFVDYRNPPDLSGMVCYSQSDYQKKISELPEY